MEEDECGVKGGVQTTKTRRRALTPEQVWETDGQGSRADLSVHSLTVDCLSWD